MQLFHPKSERALPDLSAYQGLGLNSNDVVLAVVVHLAAHVVPKDKQRGQREDVEMVRIRLKLDVVVDLRPPHCCCCC